MVDANDEARLAERYQECYGWINSARSTVMKFQRDRMGMKDDDIHDARRNLQMAKMRVLALADQNRALQERVEALEKAARAVLAMLESVSQFEDTDYVGDEGRSLEALLAASEVSRG